MPCPPPWVTSRSRPRSHRPTTRARGDRRVVVARPGAGRGGDTSEPIDLTTERLFGEDDSGIDDGPPTELFDTVADQAASPLGEPDAAADAAMRAFFERDLDEDADAKSSRFGRRR